jgi:hypothetical protein
MSCPLDMTDPPQLKHVSHKEKNMDKLMDKLGIELIINPPEDETPVIRNNMKHNYSCKLNKVFQKGRVVFICLNIATAHALVYRLNKTMRLK